MNKIQTEYCDECIVFKHEGKIVAKAIETLPWKGKKDFLVVVLGTPEMPFPRYTNVETLDDACEFVTLTIQP